jgi:UDP-N-acetylmuramoyl-tripeptide--D-alanyl-D-alanine ligase
MLVITLIVVNEYSIIQSYHYEIGKYLYHLRVNKKYYVFLYSLLCLFVIRWELLFLFSSIILFVFLLGKPTFKITNRIKRLLIINAILLCLFSVFDLIQYIYSFSFFYLFFLHYISLFIERIIFSKYLKSARRKIVGKLVIGVTGSCGKTSVKNMIYDVLINKFNVSKTPKSFNNRVGIVKGMNEEINAFDDFFICEYGVDKKGEMDKLIKIVKPKIAIITQIGNQHLLTFKSIDNILNEKVKLIEKLDSDGIGIINNDNKYLREYNYSHKNIIRYGIESRADVMGNNIFIDSSHTEFDLYIKDKFMKRVSISALSRHSVENTLAVVCVLLALNLDIEFILNYIGKVKVTPHRLEHKFIDGVEIIDDSFNSNIKGFKDAVELLGTSSKYKIVITPGIIEQGNNNFNVSKEIARYLTDVDFVCLVSDNAKYIKEEFNNLKFYKYKEFDRFIDAFKYAKEISEEKIILIENDLPNIYLN